VPLPRSLARLNKAGLNRLTRHVAPVLPGFGVVVHRGRRSGQRYETPVMLFPAADGYIIALTYGPRADWVQNVLAAGTAELRTRGRTVPVSRPRVYRDETRHGIRPAERTVLRLVHVADFLSLTAAARPFRAQPGR
jgi:deazaflavin-dependent oxidoreductase (nitroreductase family)